MEHIVDYLENTMKDLNAGEAHVSFNKADGKTVVYSVYDEHTRASHDVLQEISDWAAYNKDDKLTHLIESIAKKKGTGK